MAKQKGNHPDLMPGSFPALSQILLSDLLPNYVEPLHTFSYAYDPGMYCETYPHPVHGWWGYQTPEDTPSPYFFGMGQSAKTNPCRIQERRYMKKKYVKPSQLMKPREYQQSRSMVSQEVSASGFPHSADTITIAHKNSPGVSTYIKCNDTATP